MFNFDTLDIPYYSVLVPLEMPEFSRFVCVETQLDPGLDMR